MPKMTATSESGIVDEIEEKPWSVYGNKALLTSASRPVRQ
jgi:hypothetical protein